MKTQKLLIPIIALALLASACNKNNNTSTTLTTEQAKAAISDVNSNLANDFSDLKSSTGSAALNSFATLSATTSPFGRVQAFQKPGDVKAAMKMSLISVRDMIVNATSGVRTQGASASFGFDTKVGIYNYDFGQLKFVKSQETSTIIIIRYPKDDASKANSTNDAELQISEYIDVSTAQGYNPTSVKAALYISSVKQAGLTLTAQYDDAGDPDKASEELFINPFTISFSFDNTPAASANESFNLSKSGTTLVAVSATAVWASANDKGTGTGGNPPQSLTGTLQLKNLKFSVAFDGTKVANATSANAYVVITLTVDDKLAGHVVWATDPNAPNNGEQPYMQYNDTTQAPVLLSTLFDKLGTQIQGLVNG